jgi:hypothetical protein
MGDRKMNSADPIQARATRPGLYATDSEAQLELGSITLRYGSSTHLLAPPSPLDDVMISAEPLTTPEVRNVLQSFLLRLLERGYVVTVEIARGNQRKREEHALVRDVSSLDGLLEHLAAFHRPEILELRLWCLPRSAEPEVERLLILRDQFPGDDTFRQNLHELGVILISVVPSITDIFAGRTIFEDVEHDLRNALEFVGANVEWEEDD